MTYSISAWAGLSQIYQAAQNAKSNPNWIIAKGFLFLFLGLMSGLRLIFEHPTFKVAALLCVAIWSFCRFYYFAFYVMSNFVDPTYRFSGLLSVATYWLQKKQ